MTPEQRLDRVEYILVRLAKSGRDARSEFRQKINILIHEHTRNEQAWRTESHAINEQLKELATAQVELTKSQKLTDGALRAFINSLVVS